MHVDIQLVLEFIEQVERIFAIAIHLVHEGDHRGGAHAANFHQALCLFFHTLHAVDHEDDTVYCRKGAVGVFRKIFVARCIEDIDQLAAVFKAHYRSSHRDAPLFLDFHEVGGGGLGNLIGLHRASRLDLSAKQQQFFCQCGFARIGVRDDGEGFAPLYFGFVCHKVQVILRMLWKRWV